MEKREAQEERFVFLKMTHKSGKEVKSFHPNSSDFLKNLPLLDLKLHDPLN